MYVCLGDSLCLCDPVWGQRANKFGKDTKCVNIGRAFSSGYELYRAYKKDIYPFNDIVRGGGHYVNEN